MLAGAPSYGCESGARSSYDGGSPIVGVPVLDGAGTRDPQVGQNSASATSAVPQVVQFIVLLQRYVPSLTTHRPARVRGQPHPALSPVLRPPAPRPRPSCAPAPRRRPWRSHFR